MPYPKSSLGKIYVKKADLLKDLDPVLSALENSLVFGIDSFSLIGTHYAPVVEIGQTISDISAAAAYTGIPASANIADTLSGNWTFTTPYTAAIRTGTVQRTIPNATWQVSLTALGVLTPKASTITVQWQPRVFHGAAIPGVYDEAFIEGLSSNLQSSGAVTYTETAGVGRRLYYASPYGTPSFWIGGFYYPGTKVASDVPVTNTFGVTLNYDLWQIVETEGLGTTSVTVT